jgi:hypothetical protein
MDALLFMMRAIVQWILGPRRALQVVRVARNGRRTVDVCDIRNLVIRDGEIWISTPSGPPEHLLGSRSAPRWENTRWESPPTGRQFPRE